MDMPTAIAYLLGKLPVDEQIGLEREFFADDARFDQLVALEDELMYDYLQGGLSRDDRRRFEERFLVSPDDRHRADFAGALLTAVGGGRRTVTASPVMPNAGRWLAAAAVVVLAAGTWVATELITLRNERRQFDVARAAEQTAPRAANERAATVPAPARPPSVIALALTAGLVRGAGELKQVVIPPDTDLLQLELELKRDGGYGSYRAALQNADGRDVWSQAALTAEPRGGRQVVVARVPATAVAPGAYELILSGVTTSGAAEEAGAYQFSIGRR
jgi:hypothetical protein